MVRENTFLYWFTAPDAARAGLGQSRGSHTGDRDAVTKAGITASKEESGEGAGH